jgi:hypothetical protein
MCLKWYKKNSPRQAGKCWLRMPKYANGNKDVYSDLEEF